ncbi:MAG: hypothetical protein OXC44_02895 [Proteobacteria bacterium]|nr:hypothetical protein [Pseudomonadota bacterium]
MYLSVMGILDPFFTCHEISLSVIKDNVFMDVYGAQLEGDFCNDASVYDKQK